MISVIVPENFLLVSIASLLKYTVLVSLDQQKSCEIARGKIVKLGPYCHHFFKIGDLVEFNTKEEGVKKIIHENTLYCLTRDMGITFKVEEIDFLSNRNVLSLHNDKSLNKAQESEESTNV